MVHSWLEEQAGSFQLEDAALVVAEICSGHPVGCGSADGCLVGLLVGLGWVPTVWCRCDRWNLLARQLG